MGIRCPVDILPQSKATMEELVRESQVLYQGHEIHKAIRKIETAYQLLPEKKTIIQGDTQSGRTADFSGDVLEVDYNLYYLKKVAKLYYLSKDFGGCIDFIESPQCESYRQYMHLIKGDCMRKLKEPVNAFMQYEAAWVVAKRNNDRDAMAEVLNNQGIIYLNSGAIKKASQSFELSLQYFPKNPLLLCNLGCTLMYLGREDQAFDHFLQAKICLEDSDFFSMLSKKSKAYAESELKQIADNIAFQRHKESRKQLLARKLMAYARNPQSLEQLRGVNMEISSFVTLQRKFQYFLDEGNERLIGMYRAMQLAFQMQYFVAKAIINQVKKSETPLKTIILSNFAKLIPYAGSFLSQAIQYASEALIQAQMKQRAMNLLTFSYKGQQKDTQLLSKQVLQQVYKNVFLKLNPKAHIKDCVINLTGSTYLVIKRQEFENYFFLSGKKDPIETYGEILMVKLMQQSIFTGVIYRNLRPQQLTRDEVMKFLIKTATDLLYDDEDFSVTSRKCTPQE